MRSRVRTMAFPLKLYGRVGHASQTGVAMHRSVRPLHAVSPAGPRLPCALYCVEIQVVVHYSSLPATQFCPGNRHNCVGILAIRHPKRWPYQLIPHSHSTYGHHHITQGRLPLASHGKAAKLRSILTKERLKGVGFSTQRQKEEWVRESGRVPAAIALWALILVRENGRISRQ